MTHPTLHAPSNPSGSPQSTSTMSLSKATLLPWPASCQSTLGPEANIPIPRPGPALGSADLGFFFLATSHSLPTSSQWSSWAQRHSG